MLRIHFSEIPEDGLLVNVDDASWFPDDVATRCGDPLVEVFFERNGERILTSGVIEVVLLLSCDRCLAEFAGSRRVEFRLVLEVAVGEEGSLEQQCIDNVYNPGEIEVVSLDEPLIDIGDLLYQQILLSLQQKVLCRTGCLGICDRCGSDLNVESCACSDSTESSSFAAIGRLLKNKK